MTKNRWNTLNLLYHMLLLLLVESSEGFAPLRRAKALKSRGRAINKALIPQCRHVDLAVDREREYQMLTAMNMLRGGGVTLSLSKPVIAKVCALFLAFNGISLVVAPTKFVEKFYKIDIDKDSLETYLLKAIGAVSIGMSVNVYLSLVKGMAAQPAMGFSLLPRFLYVLKSSLIGEDLDKLGGSNNFLSTNEAVMAWTTYSLLTGAGNPILSAKVFSCMALLKGSFFLLNPVEASNKFLGIDISQKKMNKSRALCRGLGNELTTSAILMGLLAFGVEPFKAAGYTCLLWTVLLADMAFRNKTYKLMGESSPRSQIMSLLITAVFAAGFLM